MALKIKKIKNNLSGNTDGVQTTYSSAEIISDKNAQVWVSMVSYLKKIIEN